jgi:hypothetical protein
VPDPPQSCRPGDSDRPVSSASPPLPGPGPGSKRIRIMQGRRLDPPIVSRARWGFQTVKTGHVPVSATRTVAVTAPLRVAAVPHPIVFRTNTQRPLSRTQSGRASTPPAAPRLRNRRWRSRRLGRARPRASIRPPQARGPMQTRLAPLRTHAPASTTVAPHSWIDRGGDPNVRSPVSPVVPRLHTATPHPTPPPKKVAAELQPPYRLDQCTRQQPMPQPES